MEHSSRRPFEKQGAIVMKRGLLAVWSLVATMVIAPPALAQAPSKVDESVTAAAAKQANVRVIVELDSAAAGPATALANPTAYVQSTLGSAATRVQAIEGTALVVARVTAEGLRQLDADPQVKAVYEDRLDQADMMDT